MKSSGRGILFDALIARPDGAGVSRYCAELARALAALRDDVVIAVQKSVAPALELPDSRLMLFPDHVHSSMRILAQHLALPWRARRFALAHHCDLAIPEIRPWPVVVTCHDLAYYRHPRTFTRAQRAWKKYSARRAAGRAERILCDSEATARDVESLLHVSNERLRVVYPGVREYPGEAQRPAAAPEGPFILAVGTLEPRKNLPRLFDAMEILRKEGLPHRLVLSGGKGWIYERILHRLKRPELRERVIFAGYRSDAELKWLYQHASALAYVSVYEGFGFPPVEAMRYGLPVVATRAGAIEEVCGDAVEYVDAFYSRDIAAGLKRVVTDEALRSRLAAAGHARAARYDWQETARAVSSLYDEILSGGSEPRKAIAR